MSRFGVMKHLKVLEEAGLVVTKKRGREKLHFLNPVPIRLVHDRWVSKYAEPWAATLTGLKTKPGGQDNGEGLRDLHQDDARAAVGGDHRSQSSGRSTASASAWSPTGRTGRLPSVHGRADAAIAEGENLEVDPPRRLVQSMTALWSDDVKAEGTSRVTWEIEPVEDSCRLTVTHDELREGAQQRALRRLADDPVGPEDVLETGEQLTTPGLADVRERLDRQLHAPRASLAREPLVDVARARLELHPLRVPARSEVPLVGGVRVERGERVRGMGQARPA